MSEQTASTASVRPAWRRVGAAVFFASAVATQLYFLHHAYHDPHRYFGFQPFCESSTWRADVYRVGRDGRRRSVREGWRYDWPRLVGGDLGLAWPFDSHPAAYGVGATLDYMQHALDWVAVHTPDDHDTAYLEAQVTYFRNRRGPHRVTLRSADRDLPPP